MKRHFSHRLTGIMQARSSMQTLASIPEDSFRLSDFFGFRGPCTAYLSRILVVPDDVNVCIQVGHSAPFALYVNGECVGERENCDNWTAENVHLENVRLHKGENKIVLRATRVNEDAKYNVTFSLGRAALSRSYGSLRKIRIGFEP